MINNNNENTNKVRTYKRFSASLVITILITVVLLTSGSAATHVFAATQPTAALPSCSDPTGQNLPCMMVISTLPPPPNAIQCQQTLGQILPCSYGTQNLSNGNQIAVITVYVPANFVFSSPTAIKVVVHETTSSTTTKIIREIRGAGGLCRGGEEVAGKCLFMPPGPHTAIWKKAWIDAVDLNGYKNPYKPGTAEYVRYLVGYTQALQAEKQAGIKNQSVVPTVLSSPPPSSISPLLVTGLPIPTTTTQPTVDCTKNPTDPSCTQTLTPPPTSVSPTSTSPTTKTCPDGSKPDITGKCPTFQVAPAPNFAQGLTPQPACGNPGNPCPQSTPTPSNPLTTFGPSTSTNNNNPPPTNNNPTPSSSDNNPSPPSSGGDNGGGGSSSGSEGSGSSNGGGSGSNGGGSSPP
jgi:uncharacterized membrane protein YgcG